MTKVSNHKEKLQTLRGGKFPNSYLKIPVSLSKWAIQNNFIRPFQLYIYLKSSCSGQRYISYQNRVDIANDLNLSERTIRRNLKKLLQANWIGYNPKSGRYFIRSFERVQYDLSLNSRSATKFDITEINKFKAFISGAVVTHYYNGTKWAKRCKERQKGRSKPKHQEAIKVSANGLAYLLSVSKVRAHRIKKWAESKGYITIIPDCEQKDIPLREIDNLRKYAIDGHRFIPTKNGIYENKPDTVESCMHTGYRKFRKWLKAA